MVVQPLKNGGSVKIAFVGLTTTDTAVKTRSENIRGIDFVNPVDAARVQVATGLKRKESGYGGVADAHWHGHV